MRTINSTITAQLAAGRVVVRELVRLDLGSGSYGFTNAVEPITHESLTYQPLGLISVDGFAFSPGTSAQSFTVTLPASNDDGRLPTVLQGLFSEDYRDRPVRVIDLHRNADTGAQIAGVEARYGYIKDMVKRRQIGEGDVFVLECLSRAMDYSRRNARMANDLDQQRRATGDRFFEHVSQTARVQLPFGRARVN